MRKATYQKMHQVLSNALNDLEMLAGNKMADSNVTWQDVAGTAMVNLRVLADQLEAARTGNAEAGLVFPSPAEILETMEA